MYMYHLVFPAFVLGLSDYNTKRAPLLSKIVHAIRVFTDHFGRHICLVVLGTTLTSVIHDPTRTI